MHPSPKLVPFILVFLLAACGNEDPAPAPAPGGGAGTPSAGGGAAHHGAVVALGSVELGGETFSVARHGPCAPGKEAAFVVARIGAGARSGLYLWVEDAGGQQVCAPARGDRPGEDWHFHVTPRQSAAAPERVVLRLREGDLDERAPLPLQASFKPAHDGVAAPLIDASGGVAGWIELKLHDDKGDLELWLSGGGSAGQPLDRALETVIGVSFTTPRESVLELRVRNGERNEDEDGKANVRPTGTNYFIFPGASGADASWLVGAAFRGVVTVKVPGEAGPLTTPPFVLIPHGHAAGDHGH